MIQQIRINNFRNYSDLEIPIPEGAKIVVFYGENGSGKTNILESISLFFEPNGFRKVKYEDMINNASNKNYWNIQIETNDASFSSGYLKGTRSSKRVYKIAEKNVRNLDEFRKDNYVLWMTYETDRLFMLSPSDRRSFIDMLCNVVFSDHQNALKDYEKLVRERLKILKKHCDTGFNESIQKWLDILEKKISELGIKVASNRIFIANILEENQLTKNQFPSFSNKMQGTLEETVLKAETDKIQEYQNELKNRRIKDGFAGITTLGPHRSDWVVFNEDKKINAEHCSAGEQKILLTGIFLSFIAHNMNYDNRNLILLLDDIIAHLDSEHKDLLFKYIVDFVDKSNRDVMVFLTGVDRNLFEELNHHTTFFEIQNGRIL